MSRNKKRKETVEIKEKEKKEFEFEFEFEINYSLPNKFIDESFTKLKPNEVVKMVQNLISIIKNEIKNKIQKKKLNSYFVILEELLINPHICSKELIKEMINLKIFQMKELKEYKLVENWFSMMKKILILKKIEEKERNELNQHFMEWISSLKASYRRKSLELLCLNCEEDSESILQTTVSSFISDRDCRVRKTAIECLVTLHKRRIELNLVLLKEPAFGSILDGYEPVKISGIKLIVVLANLRNAYPKFVEECFEQVAMQIFSISPEVRKFSCLVLPSIPVFTHKPHLQVLQKKSVVLSSSTNTGDRQKKEQDQKMHQGALIYGLEDENREVRLAAINSTCELSLLSKDVANHAIDHLVYMVSDGSDSVRMAAINSLTKISQNGIKLSLAHLDNLLPGLEDISPSIRKHIRILLFSVNLSTVDCLLILVRKILTSLEKYPDDLNHILKCLSLIGKKNSTFTELLTKELLKLDVEFMVHEPNPDDIFYVSLLVLVLNAASMNSKILQLLPEYIFRHYSFLKDKYPEYFAQDLGANNISQNSNPKIQLQMQSDHDFVNFSLSKLEKSYFLMNYDSEQFQNENFALSLLESSIPKLVEYLSKPRTRNTLDHQPFANQDDSILKFANYIESFNEQILLHHSKSRLLTNFKYMKNLIRYIHLFIKIQSEGSTKSLQMESVTEMKTTMYQIRDLFVGFDSLSFCWIYIFITHSKLIEALFETKEQKTDKISKVQKSFQKTISLFQNFHLEVPQFFLQAYQDSQKKSILNSDIVFNHLWISIPINKDLSLKEISSSIIQNQFIKSSPEKPLQISNQINVYFPIHILLKNSIYSKQKFKVRVSFPDESENYYQIKHHDFVSISRNKQEIYKQISICRQYLSKDIAEIKLGLICGKSLASDEISLYLFVTN